MEKMLGVLLTGVSFMVAGSGAVAGDSFDNCTGFIDSLPATISKQGTWCLRKNLSTDIISGSAVTIAVNNVTINCKGYKVGGLQAGTSTRATGISSEAQNSSVRQCNIRGFFAGVSFIGTGGGHVIADNRFDGNTRHGVHVAGDGSMLRNNIIAMTGGSTDPTFGGIAEGIYVAQGEVDIIDNTISGVVPGISTFGGSSAIGIEYSLGSGVISHNRIRGLAPDANGSGTVESLGISVGEGSVLIANNHLVGTGGPGNGVSCNTSTRPRVLRDNTVTGFSRMYGGECVDAGGNFFSE
ncbi:hypothetical protein [Luteimonas suaedae]|uniref:hypothetical protein n=1 Tax=Luteimonas suaedae TaxID=2605430 RepID=UPI0011EDF6DA|nr:hypothetical protein [Luteimonas suaedae]